MQAIGRGPVAPVTVEFIYFIEDHPVYSPILGALFEVVDGGKCEIVTSSLTLLEVLVVPFGAGNQALARRYEELLRRSRGIRPVKIDRAQLRTTGHFCGTHVFVPWTPSSSRPRWRVGAGFLSRTIGISRRSPG